MEGGDADALRAGLRSAEEEVDRLSRLADDLLVLARAGRRDGLALRPGDVELDDVLTRAARGSGDVRVAPSGLRVGGRAATGAGGAQPHRQRPAPRPPPVEVRAVNRGGMVRIAVRDHGGGIPQGFAPRALDRFSRADEARATGGAGLGLAIVAAIARAHGGDVRLRDAEPGTVAELDLPTDHAKFG